MYFMIFLISTSVANYITYDFMINIFELKDSYKNRNISKVLLLPFLIFTVTIIGLNHLQNPLINLISNFTIINFISYKYFKSKSNRSIFLTNISFFLFLILFEFLSVPIVKIISASLGVDSFNDSYLTFESVTLNSIFLLLFYRFIKFFLIYKKPYFETKFNITLSFIFPIFSVLTMYLLMYTYSSTQPLAILFISTLISFGIIFLNIYLVNQYESVYKYTQTLLQLKYLEKLSESKLESYNAIRKKNIDLKHLIHDTKKHVTLIQDLYNKKCYSEANSYVNDFIDTLDENLEIFQSKNNILEVFVNHKLSITEKEGIDFKAIDNSSGLLFLSNIDIITIFSNLIDNAIESISFDGKGKINLVLEDYEKSTLISIQNTYCKVIVNSIGEYQSTKNKHSGFGLNIISKTVKKYDGIISVNHNNSIFTINILFPNVQDKSYKI